LRAYDFGQEGFGLAIAVKGAIFATLFVVHDKLHCDLGVVGPTCNGWIGAIALHIAWVAVHSGALSTSDLMGIRYFIVLLSTNL
jgi:hypothetical protein